ncbi:MAG: phospholipase [Legionella sp.]|nr:MAG: phospholipase [Legionella sp.]PJD98933.1 MAG: phospholipase [Legionella sp.]
MTPQHVISQLLESDSKKIQNKDLLKKIILTVYLGRLQINGQSPDNQIDLGNYLFDSERILFDFSRLNEQKKELFNKWLLAPYQASKKKKYFSDFAVNEYRGFTAEVKLSYIGKIIQWLQGNATEYWAVSTIDAPLNYALLGIEMCHGLQGIVIGFNQWLVPANRKKYQAQHQLQSEYLGNTKRVFITNQLVDLLLQTDLNACSFESVCKSAHPLAIAISDPQAYYKNMEEYRSTQKYTVKKPWYIRLWNWFCSWFCSEVRATKPVSKPSNHKLIHLFQNDSLSIYQKANQQLLVKENRPEIENLVYCGGGAKIFAHIGVWKALQEVCIKPKRFAGSSAGAIMALMCYLNFSAEEIDSLCKEMRQDNLVYIDFDVRGLSEPQALKTALDYAITLKIKEWVRRYNISYPQGKITFAVLDQLRHCCESSGIGEALIVTATNKRQRKTIYFSLEQTPDMEVSEAVKISASLPVVFRDTQIGMDNYNDGGVLNNFPTNAFHENNTTFLESEYGNNMQTLGVQFDNGTERSAVDTVRKRVYREHFIINWLYALLTGVNDPASGWEQDRLKLRKYAAQSILVPVGNASATNFDMEESQQRALIHNGYQATKDYIRARYAQKDSGPYKNKEIMYATFSSYEELLAYCCYRGNLMLFHTVCDLIHQSSLLNKPRLIRQADKLKALYFASVPLQMPSVEKKAFNISTAPSQLITHSQETRDELFLTVFSIFLKLTPQFVGNIREHHLFNQARHSLKVDAPWEFLNWISKIKEERHLFLYVFGFLVGRIKNTLTGHTASGQNSIECHMTFQALHLLKKLLHLSPDVFKPVFYGHWDLNFRQILRVLKTLECSEKQYAHYLCHSLKKREEPLQVYKGAVFENEAWCETPG